MVPPQHTGECSMSETDWDVEAQKTRREIFHACDEFIGDKGLSILAPALRSAYERGKAEQCAAAERQGVIKGLREAKAMTENAYKDSKAYKGAVTAKMFRQIVVAIRFRADELEKQKP
jgi:hypothetical protein